MTRAGFFHFLPMEIRSYINKGYPFYILLLTLVIIPPLVYLICRIKHAPPLSRRAWLIAPCLFTVVALTFYLPLHKPSYGVILSPASYILSPASLPYWFPAVWLSVWGALLIAHWYLWIAASRKHAKNASLFLPVLASGLLMLAIALGQSPVSRMDQGNFPLAGIVCIYTVTALICIKKGGKSLCRATCTI